MTEPHSSRRDFLKRSSKAGLAAVGSCGMGFWLSWRSRHPSEESSTSLVRSYEVDLSGQIPDMVVSLRNPV